MAPTCDHIDTIACGNQFFPWIIHSFFFWQCAKRDHFIARGRISTWYVAQERFPDRRRDHVTNLPDFSFRNWNATLGFVDTFYSTSWHKVCQREENYKSGGWLEIRIRTANVLTGKRMYWHRNYGFLYLQEGCSCRGSVEPSKKACHNPATFMNDLHRSSNDVKNDIITHTSMWLIGLRDLFSLWLH